MSQPVTWDQIIDAASDNGGKIGVQANKYEGYVVWINALISGAGGNIVDGRREGCRRHRSTVDSAAGESAAGIIEKLAVLRGRTGRPVGVQRGHRRLDVRRRRRARSWSTGPTSGTTTATSTARATTSASPATRRPSRARSRVRRTAASASASVTTRTTKESALEAARVPHQPREPGRQRRADRQHAGQRRRLRVPRAGRDLPAPTSSQLFQDSVDAAAPRTVSPYWTDISSALQSTWHPPARASTPTPRRSPSPSSSRSSREGGCCEHRRPHHDRQGGRGEGPAATSDRAVAENRLGPKLVAPAVVLMLLVTA